MIDAENGARPSSQPQPVCIALASALPKSVEVTPMSELDDLIPDIQWVRLAAQSRPPQAANPMSQGAFHHGATDPSTTISRSELRQTWVKSHAPIGAGLGKIAVTSLDLVLPQERAEECQLPEAPRGRRADRTPSWPIAVIVLLTGLGLFMAARFPSDTRAMTAGFSPWQLVTKLTR
jgi:hypothetical protein